MQKSIFLLLVLIVATAYAQIPTDKKVGLGVIFGEPTGISFKYWLQSTTAVDAAAAWSFEGENALHLHANFLYHYPGVLNVSKGTALLFAGVGGRLKFQNKSKASVRFPLGAEYILENGPFEFFLEFVPLLDLAPSTKFDLNGGIGFRFYFK